MKILFENWRSYLQEDMKQAVDIERALIVDEGDFLRIMISGRRDADDRARTLGRMFCALLDWNEDTEDQSINCGSDVWVVTSVNADQGFGPLLYDIALEYIDEVHHGVMMSGGHGETTGDVTVEAAKVWQYYFKNRNDVHKVKHPRCSEVLSPWILKNPQLKPYYEALMHVYYKSKDVLYDLEDEDKIEYR